MKDYPDPGRYLDAHVKQSTERALNGLQQTNIEPIIWAIQNRAIHEAIENYTQEAKVIRDHNLNEVIKKQKERMNQIKREGGDVRLKFCLPLALFLGFLAWYCFHQSDFTLGMCYTIGSLAFLGMLLLGAIFDRPSL